MIEFGLMFQILASVQGLNVSFKRRLRCELQNKTKKPMFILEQVREAKVSPYKGFVNLKSLMLKVWPGDQMRPSVSNSTQLKLKLYCETELPARFQV